MPRIHIAIMRKSWGLIDKIIAGDKTIESRWYKNKSRPWDQVFPGDVIYFKDSGGLVRAKAQVTQVKQYANLTPAKSKRILNNIKTQDLGLNQNNLQEVKDYIRGKKYCILIYFNRVQSVKPFLINKTGYGMQASWIITDDISKIKQKICI